MINEINYYCMTLLRQRETALAVTFMSGLEAVFGRSFVHGFLSLIKFYSLMLMACSRCPFFPGPVNACPTDG